LIYRGRRKAARRKTLLVTRVRIWLVARVRIRLVTRARIWLVTRVRTRLVTRVRILLVTRVRILLVTRVRTRPVTRIRIRLVTRVLLITRTWRPVVCVRRRTIGRCWLRVGGGRLVIGRGGLVIVRGGGGLMIGLGMDRLVIGLGGVRLKVRSRVSLDMLWVTSVRVGGWITGWGTLLTNTRQESGRGSISSISRVTFILTRI
jgi:hypothetical protein